MNVKVDNSRRLSFDAQEVKKINELTVYSPLAGILISAHSNRLRVRQLYRLGRSK